MLAPSTKGKTSYIVRLRFPSSKGAKFDYYDLSFSESLIEAKAIAFASYVVGGIPSSILSVSPAGTATSVMRFGYGDVTKEESMYINKHYILPEGLEEVLNEYRSEQFEGIGDP